MGVETVGLAGLEQRGDGIADALFVQTQEFIQNLSMQAMQARCNVEAFHPHQRVDTIDSVGEDCWRDAAEKTTQIYPKPEAEPEIERASGRHPLQDTPTM